MLTRKDFMGNHEWAFYGWREGAGHKFYGPTNAVDVWAVKKVNPQSMVHLTEKPVELAVRAIQYSSKPGENVLDLFGGSGIDAHRCRADRPACVPHGARPRLLRRDRDALAGGDRTSRPRWTETDARSTRSPLTAGLLGMSRRWPGKRRRS